MMKLNQSSLIWEYELGDLNQNYVFIIVHTAEDTETISSKIANGLGCSLATCLFV